MSISASMVKELRERTGAGMMECKKALVETDGNMEEAVELLRKSGQAKADKKASRVAADGRIAVAVDGLKAAIAEINSETDFVAKDENFVGFAEAVVNAVNIGLGAPNIPGMVMTMTGEVSSVDKDSGKIEVSILGENNIWGMHMRGSVTLTLPREG